MSQSTRQKQIIEIIESQGECSIDSLADKFATSGMTIRRDLRALADQGRVIRTHGGATVAPGIRFEFSFLKRAKVNLPQKLAIARIASTLVKAGQSIVLDSGTTTLAIAEQLRQRRDIRVITTSLPIASMLQYNPSIQLVLLGGQLRPGSPDLCGPVTESNLAMLQADLAFVGADAIDDKGGVFSESADLSNMLSKMISAATKAYIVADSSKLGRSALWRFADLRKLAGLITDEKANPSLTARLVKSGIKIIRDSAVTRSRR